MNLLIVTQTVDRADPYLGFFHAWIAEFSTHVEHVTVICLREGAHSLPENVSVLSLGKEKGEAGKVTYAFRFIRLIWRLRNEYDAVFVHMNEEYLLLGGVLWRLVRKPVALWRNHYAGSIATVIAVSLATNVFYTSKYSFTARFKKAMRMPVGVETTLYSAYRHVAKAPRSILHLSRISPSKRIELFINALGLLKSEGGVFSATIAGSALPEDEAYRAGLIRQAEKLGLLDRLTFIDGVTHADTAALFARHQVFVNCAESGMLDKTLFEAAAAGSVVLASSEDWAEFMDDPAVQFRSARELAHALESSIESPDPRVLERQDRVIEEHSLSGVISRILAT